MLCLLLPQKQLEEAQARLNNRQSGTAAPLVDDGATGPTSPGNQHPRNPAVAWSVPPLLFATASAAATVTGGSTCPPAMLTG